jgi:outer membrane receptor protein involved in Fe transport
MLLKRKYLFGTTIIAGVMAASAPAFAQTAPAAQNEEAATVEEVVVTGSRIRRDPTSSPTPLIQVSQDQLLETGLATVIDYLSTIPALSNSQIPSDTTGSGLNDSGLSIANLRALGTGRTLTLIDGRRHVGSVGGGLGVDVDTIPRLLIQNVEIITGGASSVYGADAVAGVLNFTLRNDYEGLEIDANYALINEDGQAAKRVSVLAGRNFFDDRLNVYAHAEWEQQDEVQSMDMDWLRRSPVLLGIDADPTAIVNGPVDDGRLDNALFSGVNLFRLDRPRWSQMTLANAQQPSPLNNPNVPQANCTAFNSASCYSVDPAKTWWFDGTSARLANFGQRVGNTGSNRGYNFGGDGESAARFSTDSRLPRSESFRYQVGSTFHVTDSISAYLEAKYITEETFDISQPMFYDINFSDVAVSAGRQAIITGTSGANMRWSDNAFIPANLKAAIAGNTVTNYNAPTITGAGTVGTTIAAPWARLSGFGDDRFQNNYRDLQRYVFALKGDHDRFSFVKNVGWDVSYTYGRLENQNDEYAVDAERFYYAADSVVDNAGVLGSPGAVVCRIKLLNAQGVALPDPVRGGTLQGSAAGREAISACQPYNIFGQGNQSQAGTDYVNAFVNVLETNEQHDAVASVSGQLWDFWGAGAIGVALGAEYRKEFTEAAGRDRLYGDRYLFLNGGADMPGVSFESKELFAELSVPLLRDSFLGEYAEISGSYRYADYSTVGGQEVWGANLVYRPIRDIAFKSSYNTSIRVPTLRENFGPRSQTFLDVQDPCTTARITAPALAADIRANRIANCTALAAAKGLTYDFGGTTGTPDDDYNPLYASTTSGVSGGNPFLQPEESTSFTFSTVLQPRFIPNLSIVLDYYEIEITNVIAAVTAATAAANCVNGPSLNSAACATIFRNNPAVANPANVQERSEAFKVGSPDGIGFIQGSINYAKRTVRGLDFTGRYTFDTAEMIGRNWGRFDYSINGSWLIEQKQFNNAQNPDDFTEFASTLQVGGSFPRVRFTSTLAWQPVDSFRLSWIADWQSSQDIIQYRDFIANPDSRELAYTRTGNFVRNDVVARWDVTDDVTLRAGVTNVFDAEQSPWLGTTLYSNFDPFGRRFNVGLNWKVW